MSEQILIRCINSKTNKVKNLFPTVAINKQLMKTMGWVISDPESEAKLKAWKEKKPYKTELANPKEFKNDAIVMPKTEETVLQTQTTDAPKKRGRKPKLQTA